jgi:hypothetical protein
MKPSHTVVQWGYLPRFSGHGIFRLLDDQSRHIASHFSLKIGGREYSPPRM